MSTICSVFGRNGLAYDGLCGGTLELGAAHTHIHIIIIQFFGPRPFRDGCHRRDDVALSPCLAFSSSSAALSSLIIPDVHCTINDVQIKFTATMTTTTTTTNLEVLVLQQLLTMMMNLKNKHKWAHSNHYFTDNDEMEGEEHCNCCFVYKAVEYRSRSAAAAAAASNPDDYSYSYYYGAELTKLRCWPLHFVVLVLFLVTTHNSRWCTVIMTIVSSIVHKSLFTFSPFWLVFLPTLFPLECGSSLIVQCFARPAKTVQRAIKFRHTCRLVTETHPFFYE